MNKTMKSSQHKNKSLKRLVYLLIRYFEDSLSRLRVCVHILISVLGLGLYTLLFVSVVNAQQTVLRAKILTDRDTRQNTHLDTTTLLQYVASGDINSVQSIIAKGVDINQPEAVHGATALHNAAALGYVQMLKWLLQAHADVSSRDKSGATPLIWAAYQGQTQIMSLLLQHGAKTDIVPSHSPTALIAAIQSGQQNAVKTLLQQGANPQLPNADGLTPKQAAQLAHRKVMVEMLEKLEQ